MSLHIAIPEPTSSDTEYNQRALPQYVEALKAAGAELFIEAGPGKVLCGLLKQIDPSLKWLNVEDAASLEKTLAELKGA